MGENERNKLTKQKANDDDDLKLKFVKGKKPNKMFEQFLRNFYTSNVNICIHHFIISKFLYHKITMNTTFTFNPLLAFSPKRSSEVSYEVNSLNSKPFAHNEWFSLYVYTNWISNPISNTFIADNVIKSAIT